MAWFIPAIMAIGQAAGSAASAAAPAAAGAAAAVGSGAAGAGAGAAAGAAGAAGAGTAAGAGLAGAGAGAGAASMPAAGSVAPAASGSFGSGPGALSSGSGATQAAPFRTAAPYIKELGKETVKGAFSGAGQSSPVSNSQPGEPAGNPIPQFSGFGGNENGMPSAIMPGAMDNPFGSPGVRALNSTFSKGGGD